VDARVADTSGSEKKSHDLEEICYLTGVQKYRRELASHKKSKTITSYFFVRLILTTALDNTRFCRHERAAQRIHDRSKVCSFQGAIE
jgi:hypothetical protein